MVQAEVVNGDDGDTRGAWPCAASLLGELNEPQFPLIQGLGKQDCPGGDGTCEDNQGEMLADASSGWAHKLTVFERVLMLCLASLMAFADQLVTSLTPAMLTAMPMFSSLGEEQAAILLDRHLFSKHLPEQVVVMEQDWGDSVFLITSGMAKVRTYTADGEEVVMSLLGCGDVFGEMASLGTGSRSADVVALTSLELVKLRAAAFTSQLQQQAGFALALAQLEAGRLRDLNQRFALQRSDATTRVLQALAYLATKASQTADPLETIPPLAQSEVAVLAGLARETFSRTLSKLKSRGDVLMDEGSLRLTSLQPLQKRGIACG